jgi:hypothetical protein
LFCFLSLVPSSVFPSFACQILIGDFKQGSEVISTAFATFAFLLTVVMDDSSLVLTGALPPLFDQTSSSSSSSASTSSLSAPALLAKLQQWSKTASSTSKDSSAEMKNELKTEFASDRFVPSSLFFLFFLRPVSHSFIPFLFFFFLCSDMIRVQRNSVWLKETCQHLVRLFSALFSGSTLPPSLNTATTNEPNSNNNTEQEQSKSSTDSSVSSSSVSFSSSSSSIGRSSLYELCQKLRRPELVQQAILEGAKNLLTRCSVCLFPPSLLLDCIALSSALLFFVFVIACFPCRSFLVCLLEEFGSTQCLDTFTSLPSCSL